MQRPLTEEPTLVEVTSLFSRECPSHEDGRNLIDAAASAAGVPVAVRVVEVTSDAQAEDISFPGSPTYLIDGADLAAADPDMPRRIEVCRAYELSDGRIGPLPELTQLAAALGEAGARRSPAERIET
jgi:hypothetical protein